MKNQKGVTALSMMIIIVIIILIASFSLFTSRDLVVEGNITAAYNEIKIINDAVKGLSLDDSYKDSIIGSMEISNISEYNSRVGNNLSSGKTYYYLGFNDDSVSDVMVQSLNEALDVRSISSNYIISIGDIGEVEVFLVDGVRVEDTYYYTFDEIFKVRSGIN